MERYQISLHAEDLPNVGSFFRGRSSPYASVEVVEGPARGTQLGETEHILHSLNPDWVKIFFVDADPAVIVRIKVTVWDYVKENVEPVWMGEAEFEVSSVYSERGNIKAESIGKGKGQLFCHVEKSRLGNAHGALKLHLRGLDIKNVEPGWFGLGRSDPFFEVSKKNSDHASGQTRWNIVYRSEHIDDNLNPYWRPVTIGLEELCYGDLGWPLKISVFDFNENGKHGLIGEFETTIGGLQKQISIKGNADRDQAIRLSTEEKSYKTYGLIVVLKAELTEGLDKQ